MINECLKNLCKPNAMKLASNGLGDFKFRERGYYFKHRMKKAELVCVDGIWHLIEEMVPHTRSSDGFL